MNAYFVVFFLDTRPELFSKRLGQKTGIDGVIFSLSLFTKLASTAMNRLIWAPDFIDWFAFERASYRSTAKVHDCTGPMKDIVHFVLSFSLYNPSLLPYGYGILRLRYSSSMQ